MVQDSNLPIPWPTEVKEEQPATIPRFLPESRELLDNMLEHPSRNSPVMPATIEELPNTVIVVPESLLDQNNRGGIAILRCTNTALSLEGNRNAVIESDLLERCFQMTQRSGTTGLSYKNGVSRI